MNACTIFGCAGSLVSIPWMPRYVQTGRQAAERLAAGEPVAAVHALGLRGRQQHRDVVAALGVAGREHLSARRLLEQPRERRVAGAPQVGGDARPVEVHVDGERRGRRVVRETPLFADDLGQRQAESAQLLRHGEAQVARLAQLLEVLGKEAVLLVVAPGSRLEAGQQLVGQERLMSHGRVGILWDVWPGTECHRKSFRGCASGLRGDGDRALT